MAQSTAIANEVAPLTLTLALSAPMRDFLQWVEASERTYADAMETWRSSCPRFTVWEDALRDGLITIEWRPGCAFGEDGVSLTAQGRALLAEDDSTRCDCPCRSAQ